MQQAMRRFLICLIAYPVGWLLDVGARAREHLAAVALQRNAISRDEYAEHLQEVADLRQYLARLRQFAKSAR